MYKFVKLESKKTFYLLQFVSLVVLINGIYLLFLSLSLIHSHHGSKGSYFGVEVYPILGLTLVYLSVLLNKRKRTAWIFALISYYIYLAIALRQLIASLTHHQQHLPSRLPYHLYLNIFLPIVIVWILFIIRKIFVVRSDISSFGFSLRVATITLSATLTFGTVGYVIMDNADFHQEISFGGAIHQTIDQFDLTVNKPYVPYTKRAKIFSDTLSVISTLAVVYCVYSLFLPIKLRYFDAHAKRREELAILKLGHGESEDFFKVWPRDKTYFFNENRTACIAYSVHRGIALALGDPSGPVKEFSKIVADFCDYCYLNDWSPSFIHTEPHYNSIYKNSDLELQNIGQEAVIDCKHFIEKVSANKYFRNIKNRFEKQDFKVDLLSPPHDPETLKKLKNISDEWLSLPGKTERGFVMGYFNNAYLNMCDILVLKDKTGAITAFINKIPNFKTSTASYDMVRNSKQSPGNSIDYLIYNFILYASKIGFLKVNMGLSPLANINASDSDKSMIDRLLSFAYTKGDKFYSFEGLNKFKDKYEPKWSTRYIAYKGGSSGFLRTLRALNVATKKIKHH
ncbi:MAG TPA: phosphatidylglycerol lysyltransferase domain-containing protein [Candidatus Saccharimonadia bacterium]|nr:phosphatidylglycerol lysyltransferase domain-containing protein [Candidatus Saccharimonadia bacterium]